jgi:hypothetical protein
MMFGGKTFPGSGWDGVGSRRQRELGRSVWVDTGHGNLYIPLRGLVSMSVRRIRIGQVWKNSETGDLYLVTKIYNEALSTFAVLRKTGAESETPVRIRILSEADSQSLPGFVYTQDSDSF